MNRWLITVFVYVGSYRGFPKPHRFAFDVRIACAVLFLIGIAVGFWWPL